MFAFEKRYFEKDLSNKAKISGFVFLSKFCVLSIKRFPSSAFCQGYALKHVLDFLHQI